MTVKLESQAYLKICLHALKHHKSDVIGALIGKKEDRTILVSDVIPLFHDRVLSGPLEIAFDMIESYLSQSE